MAGLGLDPYFHNDIETTIASLGITEVEILHAPVKQPGRMIGKLTSIADHRYEQKPRPALNIDIVRRLVVVKDAEEAKAAIHAVSEKFGGISFLKCLPDLVGTASALERYNVLPLMLTIPVAPAGVTVGSLFESASTQDAWAHRRNNHPAGVHIEQWHADHARAVAILKTCGSVPVIMHCEIQLMFKTFIPIRLAMHDVYKVCRAVTPVQLYEDTVLFHDENTPTAAGISLHDAAAAGMIDTVGATLAAAAAAAADGQVAAGTINVHGAEMRTPVHLAAQNGHLPIVQVLLKHKADPNIVSGDHGSTPILIAAGRGHLGVVMALLAAGANPNLATTNSNTAALYMAAQNGYRCVVDALLQNTPASDPNVLRSDSNCTPLHLAASKGHAEVIRSLINANATVNLGSKYGTPLESAIKGGHAECVEILEAALASQQKTTEGEAATTGAATESPAKRLRLSAGGKQTEQPN